MIGTIITLGYGSFGDTGKVITLGYGTGAPGPGGAVQQNYIIFGTFYFGARAM